MPDISEKRYNRLELKEKLLKNIWTEELMMEKKDYTVAYTEDAISTLYMGNRIVPDTFLSFYLPSLY